VEGPVQDPTPPRRYETVPAPAEEDAQSEASEGELWERQEREEAEEVGVEGEEQPLFLPTPV